MNTLIKKILFVMVLSIMVNTVNAKSQKTIYMAECAGLNNKDITSVVRNTLAKIGEKPVKLVFPKGVYHFSTDSAFHKFHYITNHDAGYKYIAFNLSELRNLEIDGQGSEFIFHGTILPFLIQDCRNICLRNFSIDWDIPFFVQGEVVKTNPEEGWYMLNMYQNGFSYSVENEHLNFPANGNWSFSSPGESLVFEKKIKTPIYNSTDYDLHRTSDIKTEQISDSSIIFYEKLKKYPPIGSIMIFKGPMGENRYAPAFHCLNSTDISVKDVNIYHSLGMGFLGEKSENILLRKLDVKLRAAGDRYVSTTADATHFVNCKGNVLLDSCNFENMLDDGTNVHGTYLEIDAVVNNRTLVASLKHFQQVGFNFANKGDEVWFLIAPNSSRSAENSVVKIQNINATTFEISFKHTLSPELKKGDLIENKTFNTKSFTMQNCILRNHRARNVVLKCPGKVMIRNNYFQSMMASILIRGEASMWYESGAVENVIIRNNKFENCVMGGGKQAILLISPKLGNNYDEKLYFDKNITFENNTINTFDNMIVDGSRVDGLKVLNNKIYQNNDYKPLNKESSLINIRNCRNITIEGNTYEGENKSVLQMDSTSKTTSKIRGINGFISKR